jgi:hypothetical protein
MKYRFWPVSACPIRRKESDVPRAALIPSSGAELPKNLDRIEISVHQS